MEARQVVLNFGFPWALYDTQGGGGGAEPTKPSLGMSVLHATNKMMKSVSASAATRRQYCDLAGHSASHNERTHLYSDVTTLQARMHHATVATQI